MAKLLKIRKAVQLPEGATGGTWVAQYDEVYVSAWGMSGGRYEGPVGPPQPNRLADLLMSNTEGLPLEDRLAVLHGAEVGDKIPGLVRLTIYPAGPVGLRMEPFTIVGEPRDTGGGAWDLTPVGYDNAQVVTIQQRTDLLSATGDALIAAARARDAAAQIDSKLAEAVAASKSGAAYALNPYGSSPTLVSKSTTFAVLTDSIGTGDWGGVGRGNAWPNKVAAIKGWTLTANAAISGSTITAGAGSSDPMVLRTAAVKAANPGHIILAGGTNDYGNMGAPLGLQRETRTNYFYGAARATILDLLSTASKPIVYVATPVPRSNPAEGQRNGAGLTLEQYRQALRNLVTELGWQYPGRLVLMDLGRELRDYYLGGEGLSSDGVHPNSLGDDLIAEAAMSAMRVSPSLGTDTANPTTLFTSGGGGTTGGGTSTGGGTTETVSDSALELRLDFQLGADPTKVYDKSGKGRHFTAEGGYTWRGDGLVLNGVNGRARGAAIPAAFTAGNPRTVIFALTTLGLGPGAEVVFAAGLESNLKQFGIYTQAERTAHVWLSGGDPAFASGLALVQTIVFALIYDGTTLKGFVNRTETFEQAVALTTTPDQILFGVGNVNNAFPADIVCHFAEVHSRALSDLQYDTRYTAIQGALAARSPAAALP